MELKVPYSLITDMISSINPIALSLSERTAFADGLNTVYLVLAFVNTLAIVPSLLRGKRKTTIFPRKNFDDLSGGD